MTFVAQSEMLAKSAINGTVRLGKVMMASVKDSITAAPAPDCTRRRIRHARRVSLLRVTDCVNFAV